jgi:ABC-2 type transport system ATP-binding protein
MGIEEKMSSAVIFDAVVKQYKGTSAPAVNGLNFEIATGEIYGLLGPNGAGKSTSVMMLCGLITPTHGNIHILGKSVKDEAAEIRKMIGVAPQEIALFPTLTAHENLTYFGKMYGLKSAFLKNKINELAIAFGLTEKMHKTVATFSGGMKRRLNLMAALLHEPKLLVLDEPTVGVDVQSRTMIMSYLTQLNQSGVTIIYSSHLMEEAERFCTRFGFIDEGKMVLEGTKEVLKSTYPNCANLEAIFLELTGKNVRD